LIFREAEDSDLVARTKRGRIEAYNVLVSRWERRVFNYLVRLVGNREDAMDLSQEVFLKAYQNLARLEDPARFSSWLFRIAHNEAFSYLRRKPPELESAEAPAWRPALEPVETALAVRALPVEQREAVELKICQGFKFDEIAEMLDCPISTVKSRVYSALDSLKEFLAPIDRRGVG